MVVVKIELIESSDSLDSNPYKIVRVYDDGTKQLLITERLRKSSVRRAQLLADKASVPLEIHSSRLRKTERKLMRR